MNVESTTGARDTWGARIAHMRSRRADLQRSIRYEKVFSTWEETCVPSYCHRNRLAAGVSWLRLFEAADLAARFAPQAQRALDFGASVGELGHIISDRIIRYDYVEQNDEAAAFLESRLPEARRVSLDATPDSLYDWVFAIDALEHNDNFAELLAQLGGKLAECGVLVVSGPTENWLYRLGRRISGFSGAYHKTTIYAIEDAACRTMRQLGRTTILPVLPLFRVSAWAR